MTYVVIGANYGDEGKGLMTDFIARQEKVDKVVRFNGGSQAGHTVVLPTGKSHVFSHIGSGHFAGAMTVLGKRFIVNPLLLESELTKLNPTRWPSIEVHPDAPVTTIYDMFINAAIETQRGNARHGSCGLGINETVTRGLAGYGLKFGDVKNWNVRNLAKALERIQEEWMPKRIKDLGLESVATDITTPMGVIYTVRNAAAHAKAMLPGLGHLGILEEPFYTYGMTKSVFEGAQGLALDEFMGEFPHVTRSMTGLPYAIEAAAGLGIKKLTPLYVTRAYATRHGRGPLPYEGSTITENDLIDLTNVKNEWQESLRYAPLDVGDMRRRIQADLDRSRTLAHVLGVELKEPELAVTCLDQLGPNVRIISPSGNLMSVVTSELPRILGMQTGVTVRYGSYGSTAEKVVRFDKSGV